MKKIILAGLLLTLISLVPHANAQMMGSMNSTTTSAEAQQETAKDEQEGKAIWDKLQRKEVTCTDLKDDDFDVLGDYFMGNMMGTNHAAMNENLTKKLGEAGEKQMHISLGKRLSGCDTNATYPPGMMGYGPMMGGSFANGNGGMMAGYYPILGEATWLAGIVFLVSGSIFFIREILRKK